MTLATAHSKLFKRWWWPGICWCSETKHAPASPVLHQPASSLSAIPAGTANGLDPESFGCQGLHPASVTQWYGIIFYTFECPACTLLTTVSF